MRHAPDCPTCPKIFGVSAGRTIPHCEKPGDPATSRCGWWRCARCHHYGNPNQSLDRWRTSPHISRGPGGTT